MSDPPAPVTLQEGVSSKKKRIVQSALASGIISIGCGIAATTYCNQDGYCGGDPDRRAYLTSLIKKRNPFTDFSATSEAFEWTWKDAYTDTWETLADNDDLDDRMVQRFSLASLFYSTNGLTWSDEARDGWLDSNKAACEWNMNDISCATPFKVSAIDLSDNNLFGYLPTEVAHLTELTSLDFSANQLTGSIGSELGRLTELASLNLSDNQLTGFIPTRLGLLTELTFLDFSDNQLTSYIPPHLGWLTELTSLDLSNNRLSGSVPTFLGWLTKLQYLDLSNTQLTGTIPSSLCRTVVSFSYDCNRITCHCCGHCAY